MTKRVRITKGLRMTCQTIHIVSGRFKLISKLKIQRFILPDLVHDPMEGINHSISSNRNRLICNPFCKEILTAERCRSKIVCRDASCNLAIHLLRPWAIDIVRTQTSFNMSDRDLLIECRKSRSRRSRCITMDQHDIWTRISKYITHACKHTGRHIIKVLSLLHDVQIIIRSDFEEV